MTREEAIKEVRAVLENLKSNLSKTAKTAWEKSTREAFETLIPEFKESEDERTRKELLEVIRHCYEDGGYALCTDDYKKYSDYLEKQEQKPTPDWMPKFLDELRSKKHYFDWDEHRDIEGYILAIIKWIAPDYFHRKENEQKPILEVFGFKVGDAVRLKDGDGRKHIIKSFEEVEGVHGPNFYHVEFEDNSASDGIYPGEEYPNGYYTQMEKIEEEQKPVWSEEDMTKLRDVVRMIEDSGHVKSIREHYKEFLTSLPERFNLRSEPLKELSLEKAIKWFEDTFFFENRSSGRGEDYEISTQDFDSMEEMYDSFRKSVMVDSEPLWKPSEGQMRALKSCVSGWLDNTDGNLESLYEDLQKRYGIC